MDEMADQFVSEILEQTALNVNELLQKIQRWEVEERARSDDGTKDSSDGCYTQQKVERHLGKFFGMRRVFAEHREDVQKDEDITCQSSSLTILEESMTPRSSSWMSIPNSDTSEVVALDSLSTTTAITEADQMLVSQVTDEAVTECTEAESASKAKKPAGKSFFKRLKSACLRKFSGKQSKKVKKVSNKASKMHLTSMPLEFVEEGNDATEKDLGDIISPAPISSIPSPSGVDEVPQPEIILQAESTEDFQEERRSGTSTDSRDRVLRSAGKNGRQKVAPLSECHKQEADQERSASPKSNLTYISLESVEEEVDITEKDMRGIISPARVSSIPSPSQVDEVPQPEIIPQAETTEYFQEERIHRTSTDSLNRVLRSAADSEGEVSTPDLMDSCSKSLDKRPDTESRLSTRSEENRKSTSSASSLDTTSDYLEVANGIVAQVIEQAANTLESRDSDSKTERPARESFLKKMKKGLKKGFGKIGLKKVAPLSECHQHESVQERRPSPNSKPISSSLKVNITLH